MTQTERDEMFADMAWNNEMAESRAKLEHLKRQYLAMSGSNCFLMDTLLLLAVFSSWNPADQALGFWLSGVLFLLCTGLCVRAYRLICPRCYLLLSAVYGLGALIGWSVLPLILAAMNGVFFAMVRHSDRIKALPGYPHFPARTIRHRR